MTVTVEAFGGLISIASGLSHEGVRLIWSVHEGGCSYEHVCDRYLGHMNIESRRMPCFT